MNMRGRSLLQAVWINFNVLGFTVSVANERSKMPLGEFWLMSACLDKPRENQETHSGLAFSLAIKYEISIYKAYNLGNGICFLSFCLAF